MTATDRLARTPETLLEAFLQSHGIKPAHLAREAGYSRQHLLRIRTGRMEPTRRCIKAIVTHADTLRTNASRQQTSSSWAIKRTPREGELACARKPSDARPRRRGEPGIQTSH